MAAVPVAVSSLPAVYSFTANASTSAVVYTIPPALFARPIQITVNLCSAPDAYSQSDSARFTAYTNASFTYARAIRGGFANLTIPVTEDRGQLTVALDATGAEDIQDYTFELGITAQPDLPWHTLDRVPLYAFEDSDNTSALFTSPTYPSAKLETPPDYDAVIALSQDVREDLGRSVCYIRSLPSAGSVSSSTTTRGVVELTVEEGGWEGEAKQEGRRVQFLVADLQVASNYSLWGISQAEQGGSRLYQKQYFATKRDDRCRLVGQVPFCPEVAYSIPAPPTMSTEDLLDLYGANINPIMDNFNTTLSTFPCDGELRKKQGMYSPVRTCSQCLSAYRSWLCSVRMPRCTDFVDDILPNNEDDDNDENDDAIRTYQRTSANASRTSFLPQEAFPYSEVPPCIDVCAMVRASCPPLISSPFQCPLKGVTMEKSYSTPFTQQISFSNVQGGDDPSFMSLALEENDDEYVTRSKDRFGNVKCNDMGVLNLVERRRWSGITKRAITIVGSSSATASQESNLVALFTLVACISALLLVISL